MPEKTPINNRNPENSEKFEPTAPKISDTSNHEVSGLNPEAPFADMESDAPNFKEEVDIPTDDIAKINLAAVLAGTPQSSKVIERSQGSQGPFRDFVKAVKDQSKSFNPEGGSVSGALKEKGPGAVVEALFGVPADSPDKP